MAGKFRSPFRVKIVDLTGTSYGMFADTQDLTWTPELSAWATLQYRTPTTSAAALESVPGREAQLWYTPRTGTPRCLHWGPIVTREADDRGDTQIQCFGSEWYLSQIQLGPVLTNYLLDPDFADATLANWTAMGTVTQSSDTTIVRKGTRSIKLVSSAEGLDNGTAQEFVVDNSAGTEPLAVFVAGRVYIVATGGTPYIGPAYQERGLFVKRIESGVDQVEATGIVGKWATLNNSVPRNAWVKIFAPAVSVPAGAVQTIHVRPMSVGGTCYWATMVATIQESSGANTVSTYADLNTIIGNLLTYGQDTSKHKLNYGIAGPSGTFGKSLSRQFQFFDHGMLWGAALRPLVDAGICDLAITWNAAATTRALTTYTSKGSYKPELALILGRNAKISSHLQDLTQTARTVTVLSQGMANEPKVGAEEKVADDVGFAADDASTSPVELVISETTLDGLDDQATTELARRSTLVHAPAWNTDSESMLSGGLDVGDTVPFRASDGWIDENTNRRVVTMTLTAPDTLTVTGN